jgi:hypothetical protein
MRDAPGCRVRLWIVAGFGFELRARPVVLCMYICLSWLIEIPLFVFFCTNPPSSTYPYCGAS